jgi:hypothetical protein
MSANEPQTLRDEYYRITKILDAEYKPASVEEQHQHKILLQKYEHLFDRTLEGFRMEHRLD